MDRKSEIINALLDILWTYYTPVKPTLLTRPTLTQDILIQDDKRLISKLSEILKFNLVGKLDSVFAITDATKSYYIAHLTVYEAAVRILNVINLYPHSIFTLCNECDAHITITPNSTIHLAYGLIPICSCCANLKPNDKVETISCKDYITKEFDRE